MGNTSKGLLRFEHKTSSTSPLESALLVCCTKDSFSESHKPDPAKKPSITPIPQSQVLGKVQDFLGVMAEANKRLELDAKNNSQAFDIEILDGNESEVIEMDLMLGVAHLHTPEALAAAESAITGNQPAFTVAGSSSSSETESDDSSLDSDYKDESDNDRFDDNKTSSPMKLEKTNPRKDHTVSEAARYNQSKKRSRIMELS